MIKYLHFTSERWSSTSNWWFCVTVQTLRIDRQKIFFKVIFRRFRRYVKRKKILLRRKKCFLTFFFSILPLRYRYRPASVKSSILSTLPSRPITPSNFYFCWWEWSVLTPLDLIDSGLWIVNLTPSGTYLVSFYLLNGLKSENWILLVYDLLSAESEY